MRTVVNNDTVAHYWANQTQTTAHSGSLRFAGPHLYSYSTLIARIVEHGGRTAVLHSSRRWSVTTSGHQSLARRASNHHKALLVYDPSLGVAEQRAAFATSIDTDIKRAGTCTRAPSRNKIVRELSDTIDRANEFCAFFGLPGFETPTDLVEAAREIVEKEAAKAKKDAAKRKRDLKRDHTQFMRVTLEHVSAWQDGTRERIGYGYRDFTNTDYLRIKAGEPETVETSQGAEVPTEHVRRASGLILSLLRAGRAWESDGKMVHVGVFQVQSVAADGTVRAGCHKFSREELERFAAVLGEPAQV